MPIPDLFDGQAAEQIDADGGITIGPLPRGVTTMAVDVPPLMARLERRRIGMVPSSVMPIADDQVHVAAIAVFSLCR